MPMFATFTVFNLSNVMGSTDRRINHLPLMDILSMKTSKFSPKLTRLELLFLRNISTTRLFIGIDQGDWLVARINPPLATQLPGSMAFGATDDQSNAYEVAGYTAINTQGT
ncbi:hypothetical protein EAE96_010765 [Botrytis aclada]|nr:hypothetical protein EAE96_010765 [Botrytis aclada]